MTSDKETTAKHNINIFLTMFAKATSPLHPLPSPLEQELPGGCSSLHGSGKWPHHGGSVASASSELPEAAWGQTRPLRLPLLMWLLWLSLSCLPKQQVQIWLGKCRGLQIPPSCPDAPWSCFH